MTLLHEFEKNVEAIIKSLEGIIGQIDPWFIDLKTTNLRFIPKKTTDLLCSVSRSFCPTDRKDSSIGDFFPKILPFLTQYLPRFKDQIVSQYDDIKKQILEIVSKCGEDPLSPPPNPVLPWAEMCGLKGSIEQLASDLRYCVQIAREDQAKSSALASTEQNAAPAKIIIENFKGVLGDVQAENVQTGDYSSIHKQPAKGKKAEKWYHNRTIQNALIVSAASILLAVIGWFLNYYYFKTNLVQQRGNPTIQAPRIPQPSHRSSAKPTQILKEPVKVQKPQLIGIRDEVNEPNKR